MLIEKARLISECSFHLGNCPQCVSKYKVQSQGFKFCSTNWMILLQVLSITTLWSQMHTEVTECDKMPNLPTTRALIALYASDLCGSAQLS